MPQGKVVVVGTRGDLEKELDGRGHLSLIYY